MKKVRVGIVGTGGWTSSFQIPQHMAMPEAEVVAISGRRPEPTRELAEKYSIPHQFTNYETMISSGLIDCVIIATSDEVHHPIAMAALNAGLHVHCEKPLALTLEQAREMRDAARAKGVITYVDHMWRDRPAYRYVQELLSQGYIGHVHGASFAFRSGGRQEKDANWHFDASRSIGALGTLGSHMVDLARYFLGDITSVSAILDVVFPLTDQAATVNPQFSVANDQATLLVEFSSGATGQINASMIDASKMLQRVELHGASGSLIVETHVFGATIVELRAEEPQRTELVIPDSFGRQSTMEELIETYSKPENSQRRFIRAILGETTSEITFDDGYEIQRVLAAAVESHESGLRVTLG